MSRLLRPGRPDATYDFVTALSLNPLSLPALNHLAHNRLAADDPAGALQYIRAAVTIAPHDPETLNIAGMVASAAGLDAEAEVLLKRAIAADPMFTAAHRNLCALWGKVLQRFAPDMQRKRDLLRTLHWISRYAPELSATTLLRENRLLRSRLMQAYRGRWQNSDTRILLHPPLFGPLRQTMENWAEVLGYIGIRTRLLGRDDQTEAVFEQFRPDVFITIAAPAQAARLDREYIKRYRHEHGLRIGQIVSLEPELPPCDFLLRLDGAPDCIPAGVSETPIVNVPPAINPLRHYMRRRAEVWDYAYVGDNTPETIERLKACLLPVMKRSSGVLAGAGWDIGLGEIRPAEEAILYNFSRICLNFSRSRDTQAVSERTLLIPACGGFELFDNPRATRGLFRPDELAVADSDKQFVEMFDYYRENPDERLPIIRAGMRRVYAEHTLFHVMERLVEFLGIGGGEARPAGPVAGDWARSESRPITWADRFI